MIAEKRYRAYENVSNLLLSWLSLSVLAWAVVRNSQSPSVILDTYTAILSVFVFAFSIITFGFRFGETATLHRECYLRLQKLYDCESSSETLNSQYHEILAGYGNHDSRDYEALVIDRTLLNSRKLWGKDGREVTWSAAMLVKWVARVVVFWLVAAIIFAIGLGPYLLIFRII